MGMQPSQVKALSPWANLFLWLDKVAMEFYGISVYVPGAGTNSGISAIFPSTSGTSTFSPYQHAHKGKNALTGLL